MAARETTFKCLNCGFEYTGMYDPDNITETASLTGYGVKEKTVSFNALSLFNRYYFVYQPYNSYFKLRGIPNYLQLWSNPYLSQLQQIQGYHLSINYSYPGYYSQYYYPNFNPYFKNYF